MTSDALSVVSLLFSTIWSIFTSFTIPGTNTTPAEFAIFILVVSFTIRLVRKYILGGDDRD